MHILWDICLDISMLIQRVVRAVHASDHKLLSEILINGKQSRNDALRARRIKISLMRTFMRQHDFRVYYIRMHCVQTQMFPWLYRLRIRSIIFFAALVVNIMYQYLVATKLVDTSIVVVANHPKKPVKQGARRDAGVG